jgi:hypothetical protein
VPQAAEFLSKIRLAHPREAELSFPSTLAPHSVTEAYFIAEEVSRTLKEDVVGYKVGAVNSAAMVSTCSSHVALLC